MLLEHRLWIAEPELQLLLHELLHEPNVPMQLHVEPLELLEQLLGIVEDLLLLDKLVLLLLLALKLSGYT